MRKVGLIEAAWAEYLTGVRRLLPAKVRSFRLTPKVAFIVFGVVTCELIVVAIVYAIWGSSR